MKKFIIITGFISSFASCESTTDAEMVETCPRITCSEPLGEKVCYMHSGTNPVEWIKLYSCPSG